MIGLPPVNSSPESLQMASVCTIRTEMARDMCAFIGLYSITATTTTAQQMTFSCKLSSDRPSERSQTPANAICMLVLSMILSNPNNKKPIPVDSTLAGTK